MHLDAVSYASKRHAISYCTSIKFGELQEAYFKKNGYNLCSKVLNILAFSQRLNYEYDYGLN